MQNINNVKTFDRHEDISLSEFINILNKRKKLITFFTVAASILSLIYSFTLPNIYVAKSILNPSISHNDSLNSSYSGFANFAGINLAQNNPDNNSVQAKEKINSFSFFNNNILPNIFLPNLMAFKSWNTKENKAIYNKDIYDLKTSTWKKDKNGKIAIPSPQESFKAYRNHVDVSENKQTGFVLISVQHQSPFVAKRWNEIIINEINLFYKTKDTIEIQKNIDFLNKRILTTNLTEMKEVLANLLQKETQKMMLAEVNDAYVYEYIDPPYVPELKSSPNRSIILMLGILVGLFSGIFFVFILRFLNKE